MSERKPLSRGALVGWRRQGTETGCLVTLQVASSADDFVSQSFDRVELALNDRQLRSLARDLARAAEERGLQLRARRRPLRFWRKHFWVDVLSSHRME